jgi:spore photoproduct lyase
MFEKIIIDETVKETATAQAASVSTPSKICKLEPSSENYIKGKKTLYIGPKKGPIMDTCASLHDDYICCNIHVIKTISNCPFNCTYCFLQNYLNNPTLSAIADIDAVMSEIKERIDQEPNRLFRIGTWELGDSLALEHLTKQAEQLILAFSHLDNAILDLRTKSNNVDSLLKLDHKGKTVISWTLSPSSVIEKEERLTSSLIERLEAMKKTTEAGYLTSLHFDPMIRFPNWEEAYSELIKTLFDYVAPDKIAWISIGSLRFNPEMKKKIEHNYPNSKITTEEIILGPDNKMRYIKPQRIQMYQHLIEQLSLYLGKKHKPIIHLCMERKDVWESVFKDDFPKTTEDLDTLFTRHLKNLQIN